MTFDHRLPMIVAMRSPMLPPHLLAWLLPAGIAVAAWRSPVWALLVMVLFQIALALLERLPAWQQSPPALPRPRAAYRWVLRLHVLWQAGLLALGVGLAASGDHGPAAVVALGVAIGGVTGSQGITFAHELGHARTRVDRLLAWLLMGSVLYGHFMVEHYRGHHARAATRDDPASARRGESLWRFLPRTLAGSLRSAWRLEARQLGTLRRGWWRSPLAWATGAQAAGLVALGLVFGPLALLFWLVQAGHAVFLLEAINYIEHYGLQRGERDGRREPFGVMHAWNADARLTNRFIANLQRHSDHHMHAWKPYETLEALPGPQLPTGYAGCLFLASVPPLWFGLMNPRLPQPAA